MAAATESTRGAGRFTRLKARFVRAALLAGLAVPLAAWGHKGVDHDAEEEPSLSLSLGVGLRHLSADTAFPYPRLPGVLEAGSPRADERGSDLDYAELGLSARFSPQLNGALRYTRHGGADPHTELEALWLEARGGGLTARGGRQELPLGFENLEHAHARTFGIAPLTLRATVDEAWIADGLRVDWALPGGFAAGAGAWQNRSYPGTESGGVNLTTLRLAWRGGPWHLEAGYAETDAEGRALLTTGEGGHTHSVPSCDSVTADRVCFHGDVALWSVAARWRPRQSRWWLGGEYWYKRERGRLDSIYGTPDYRGEIEGGWVDAGFRLAPTVTVAARAERLQMNNHLNGANAGLVAAQAGIVEADGKPMAMGLVAAWSPSPALRLLGEWHRDDAGDTAIDVFLLRAQLHWGRTLF